METPEHLTYFLRNMYADQEATVRTGHGTMDWFKIGIGVMSKLIGHFLSSFYEEYITQIARLNETPAGIKFAGRNINNLRYADDTTLMAKSEEKLKYLLIRVKEN